MMWSHQLILASRSQTLLLTKEPGLWLKSREWEQCKHLMYIKQLHPFLRMVHAQHRSIWLQRYLLRGLKWTIAGLNIITTEQQCELQWQLRAEQSLTWVFVWFPIQHVLDRLHDKQESDQTRVQHLLKRVRAGKSKGLWQTNAPW